MSANRFHPVSVAENAEFKGFSALSDAQNSVEILNNLW